MPTEIAIVVAGIRAVFIVFAAALAWSDHYSSRHPGEAE